jgi:peptide/nickel transport system ATP-binding protein
MPLDGGISTGHVGTPTLEVRGLNVAYASEMGLLSTVRDFSMTIRPGEVYGLVGESGSGKTTLARAVVRYLPRNGRILSGRVLLGGTDLLALSAGQMRGVWGARITMVHQDPSASVNPSIPVGDQVGEVARAHLHISASEAKHKALEMLEKVQLPDPHSVARRYPHQLSGGMLQRIVIAAALITNPDLLIMDEPTTSLDVTTEAVILDLIRELLGEFRTAVLYITHNLGVVGQICHRVGVMYAGQLVEEGPVQEVFKKSLFPYTMGLLGCVPRVDLGRRGVHLDTIPGSIPRPEGLPSGCVFAPRCPMVQDQCAEARPAFSEPEPGHSTGCRRWSEVKDFSRAFASEGSKLLQSSMAVAPIELQARHIRKHYELEPWWLGAILRRPTRVVQAVDDMTLTALKGSTIGIVGESGCGKTTFARCVVGLEQPNAGEVELEGRNLAPDWAKRPPEDLRKIQAVFQNPDASLNPQQPVGVSVGRPLILKGMSKREVRDRVRELFRAVRIPEDYVSRLPQELSGGEKQRVAIARAFAANPSVVICDEPLSSLDVSVQASLMNLLAQLQGAEGTTYLFISHDIAVVRHLSDQIAVVYLGQVIEIGPAESIFSPPHHPYTEALFSAIPLIDPGVSLERIRLVGSVPSAIDVPSGCRFHTRCPRKTGRICETEEPVWQDAGDKHLIRCHISAPELNELQRGGKGSLVPQEL